MWISRWWFIQCIFIQIIGMSVLLCWSAFSRSYFKYLVLFFLTGNQLATFPWLLWACALLKSRRKLLSLIMCLNTSSLHVFIRWIILSANIVLFVIIIRLSKHEWMFGNTNTMKLLVQWKKNCIGARDTVFEVAIWNSLPTVCHPVWIRHLHMSWNLCQFNIVAHVRTIYFALYKCTHYYYHHQLIV